MTAKELFKAFEKNEIAPVYLFTGTEKMLIEQAVDSLKRYAEESGSGDFGIILIDGETQSPEVLFEALETVSFFGGIKLILVRNTPYFKSQQDKLSDNHKERLEAYLSNPMVENCLVFIAEQTDKRKRLAKQIVTGGGWVEFGKLERGEFETWIKGTLQTAEKEMASSELKYLVEMTGYLDKNSDRTLLEIQTDLERLFAFSGSKNQISKSDIDTVLEKPLDYNIFQMVDHVAEGDAAKALLMLKELVLDGEAEIKILFMIARHFRILLRCKVCMDQGYTGKDMASRLGVQPFLVKKYMSQASTLGMKGITAGMELCLETDRGAKTGRLNPQVGLEMLIVKLGELGKQTSARGAFHG